MKPTILTIFVLLVAISAVAQQPLPLLDESSIRIDGTSNQSDWSVELTEMDGALWLSQGEGDRPDSVYFSAAAEDLKSGKSTIMDRVMYEALKTDQHPRISYSLGRSGIEPVTEGDATSWNTVGTLELAGVSDTLGATVTGHRDGDRLVFSGRASMSMREHDMSPPTAMFGALRTREWVTITFNLVFGD